MSAKLQPPRPPKFRNGDHNFCVETDHVYDRQKGMSWVKTKLVYIKINEKKLTYSWRRKIVSEKVLETSVTWLEKRKKKNIVEIWPSSYETQSKSALTPNSQDYPLRKYLFMVVGGASYEIFRVFQRFWTVLRLFNLFLSICIAFVNFFNNTTVLVVIFVNKEFYKFSLPSKTFPRWRTNLRIWRLYHLQQERL